MRGRQHHHRDRGIALAFLFGDRHRDRGVGIDQVAGLAQRGADRRRGLVLEGAIGGEQRAHLAERARGNGEPARLRERRHRGAHRLRIAPAGVEQQPLEVRRHLDVHRRRGRRHDVAHLVGAARERARQDVVDIGGDGEPVDRQAHALGDIAGEHVAEIAGGHREGDLAMRRAERHGGDEIVDDLGDDAGEVDRVDAGEPDAVAEGGMVEHRLHQRLAIVEGAFDGQRMDVVFGRRRHHAPLHRRDAAVGKQHDDVDLGAAAKRLDRRAAGVAGGRDHDGGALAAPRQRAVHQTGEQLHRQVLEGERRPVEQLEHEAVRRELDQRRHGGMAERVIGLPRHARELGILDRAGDEGRNHLAGDLGIGASGEPRDARRVERRPRLRHIKPAIAREPGEGHVDKSERRGLAAGRDVLHEPFLEPFRGFTCAPPGCGRIPGLRASR